MEQNESTYELIQVENKEIISRDNIALVSEVAFEF